MGYDITYHPIKETELNEWYFDLDFQAILNKDYTQIQAIAARHHLEEHSINFYKDAAQSGAKALAKEPFEHTHGYFAAVVQGCFKKYFYLRDAAFSFLMEEKPYYKSFTKPWADITGKTMGNPAINQLDSNYSSGVYIPADQVIRLINEYHSSGQVKTDLDEFFSKGRIDIFLKALKAATQQNDGLLEASEIIIPNPLNLNETDYFTNLLNCEIEGAILYQKSQQETFREIERQQGLKEGEFAAKASYQVTHIPDPKQEKKEKKGFFKRLFGGSNS